MAPLLRTLRRCLPCIAAVGLVASDLLCKVWVTSTLAYGELFPLLPGWLYFVWRTNWRYVAGSKRWGLSSTGNLTVQVMAGLLILTVYLAYRRRAGLRTLANWGSAALLAGLGSHIIDTVLRGGVVDHLWSPALGGWSFDLGDVALVVGGLCVGLEIIISPLSPAGRTGSLDDGGTLVR